MRVIEGLLLTRVNVLRVILNETTLYFTHSMGQGN